MRYLMVDRVLEFEADRRVLAVKAVTRESDVMEHHFYNFPLFPGALTLEVMAQVSGYLAIRSAREQRQLDVVAALSTVERAHFRRPVLPGDALKVEATQEGATAATVHTLAVARVEDEVVAKARLVLAVQPFDAKAHADVALYLRRFFESLERKGGWFDKLS